MPDSDSEKSFGRKLLSFFVNEETPATPTSANPVPAPRPVGPSYGTPASSAPAGAAASGSVDTKFIDHFASVLQNANLKGPDYFEFRETLRSLSSLGLIEEKQFQAAWASFKALGGISEVSVLTNTANQYVATLDGDRNAFLKSLQDALTEKVGGLQTEQKQLQTENDTLSKQITELQNRITANNDRLSKIGGEIEQQSGKLAQNKANYEATYAHFVEQIKGDIAKIGAYLK